MFDAEALSIPCPGCGHSTSKTVRWIKANDQFTCEGCGASIQLERDKLIAGLNKAEDAIADLKRKISQMKL